MSNNDTRETKNGSVGWLIGRPFYIAHCAAFTASAAAWFFEPIGFWRALVVVVVIQLAALHRRDVVKESAIEEDTAVQIPLSIVAPHILIGFGWLILLVLRGVLA